MEIIDLSRELFHRTQTHPSHPPVIMTVWNDHSEKKVAGDTVFSSKALSIALSDHAGTYVDAPVHFDPRPGALSIDQVPLANFITSAFCIDLRTAKRPWRQFGRVGTTPAQDGPSRMSATKFSPSSPPRPAGARGDQVQILPARNAPHAP